MKLAITISALLAASTDAFSMSMKAGEFLIFDCWKVWMNNMRSQNSHSHWIGGYWCLHVNLISYDFEHLASKGKLYSLKRIFTLLFNTNWIAWINSSNHLMSTFFIWLMWIDTGSSRRNILKTGAAIAAGVAAPAVSNAYSVPDLLYPFDALEPYIDAPTMKIHHDKHHGTCKYWYWRNHFFS